ncbi:tetratricopeptide repeat protein [Joostella atrarenae]|uniref:Tetratricopeptide repeat protein n=1 Tax=Joostella atrarenae TaxID=679257 RepID=A0ABS9J7N0_9FLAO|nr:tetratricopeptide repeat protein [Joostella atrarenae]MCF8716441.1 tetratricopeptide repeat protein [Joostella atrarenae]
MRLPRKINEISTDLKIEVGVYPPNGFLQFNEASLGNGDYFGLYWEFGKENKEPIVCEMIHDEGIIEPKFSSLDKFLEWYELNDFDWGEEEIEDESFYDFYLDKGNEYLKQNNPEKAIEFYKKSTDSFGELSENWFKLASQLKRVGNEKEFQESIINSILSNWAIEFPSQNALRMLKTLNPIEELENHPLIKNRENIEFNFGGKKENKDYIILNEIIKELHEIGDINRALLMEQNYALKMYWETSSFQERYNFNIDEWRKEFEQKTKKRINNVG